MEQEEKYISTFLRNPKFKKWVLENDTGLDAYWKAHIHQFPEQQEALECAKMILNELKVDAYSWEKAGKEKLLLRILDNMKEEGSPSQVAENIPKHTSFKPLIFCALLFFLLGLFFIQNRGLVFMNESNSELETSQWIKRSTKKGQKSKIHLADGSIVILNAQSEINYQKQFGITNRDILLKGEAFFEVATDSLPFRVISDELITTALGTAFNINNYQKGKPKVKLASGKVTVENQREKLYLRPGEEAFLHENDRLQKQEFNPQSAFLWKDGILNFEKESLKEVFRQLEIWYGIEFRVKGNLDQAAIVSGRFDNDNLENVLETISYAVPFHFEIKNLEVFIQPKMK